MPRTIALSAGDAALTFVLSVATFLAVGIFGGGGLAGLAAAEVIGLCGVPLLVVATRRLPLAALGLTRPPWRAIAGAALIGATIWYVDLRIAEPLLRATDDHGEAGRQLSAMVTAAPLAAIIILTLVPAIGEELACRGLLALGLRHRLGGVTAVAISAVAFAAMHPSPVRLLPMAVLGTALGILAVRSGSVIPAMVAHAVNNALALIIGAGHLDALVGVVEAHPDLTLLGCVAGCLAGLGIAWRTAPTRW